MGCAGTGIRSGLAKQTEMGGVEDVKVRRSERFSDRGRPCSGHTWAEDSA